MITPPCRENASSKHSQLLMTQTSRFNSSCALLVNWRHSWCQLDWEQNSCHCHDREIAAKLSQPGTPWNGERTGVGFICQQRWKMCSVVINSLPKSLKSFPLQPKDCGWGWFLLRFLDSQELFILQLSGRICHTRRFSISPLSDILGFYNWIYALCGSLRNKIKPKIIVFIATQMADFSARR